MQAPAPSTVRPALVASSAPERSRSAVLRVPRTSTGLWLGCGLASVALIVASLPSDALPDWLALLAFAGIAPLCFALRGTRSAPRAAAWSFAFGALLTACIAEWLVATLHGMGVRWLHAIPLFTAIVVYHALLYAAFGALFVRLQSRLGGVLSAVLAWGATDAIRLGAVPELGFLQLGHALHALPRLAQSAELFGVAGLTVLVVATSAGIAESLVAWRDGRSDLARLRASAVVGCIVLAASWGDARMRAFDERPARGATTRVAVVQVAIDQRARWGPPAQRERNLARHLAVTRRAVAAGAVLVVWPETAIEQRLGASDDPSSPIARALGSAGVSTETARRLDAATTGPSSVARTPDAAPDSERPSPQLVAGIVRRDDAGRFFNSVVQLDAAGRTTAAYDKQRLVPISESLPEWVAGWPAARRAFRKMLRFEPFTPGDDGRPLRAGSLELGAMICFEAVAPQIARDRVAQGASALLSVANDAILAGTTISARHFALTAMRAIEHRRPLVRAANRGIGAIVSPSGRTLARLEPREGGYLIGDVAPRSTFTFYQAGGHALPSVLLGAAIFACALPRRSDADGSD